MKNRELEFRVWNGEKFSYYTIFELCSGVPLEYPPSIVFQQYTGLKDKNGAKIFEGDRLRHYPGFGCSWEVRESTVVYEECAFWEKYNGFSFVLSDRDQALEVIGNLYE